MRSQLSTAGYISVLSSHSCRLGSAGSALSPSSFLPATAELHPTDTPEPVFVQPQLPVKMWPHCRQTPAPLSPPASGELPAAPGASPPAGKETLLSTTAAGFTSLDPLGSCLMPHQENMCRSAGQADAAPGGAAAGCGPLPGKGELGHGGPCTSLFSSLDLTCTKKGSLSFGFRGLFDGCCTHSRPLSPRAQSKLRTAALAQAAGGPIKTPSFALPAGSTERTLNSLGKLHL